MADDKSNPAFISQTQQQRWVKYGANVALTVLVVIVLAIVLVAIAERQSHRIDTTANQEYSLKPQTINIIKGLTEPVKIVSLYTHPQNQAQGSTDFAAVVADLLDEYKQDGKNIDIEVIDPVANPSKVDDLIATVMSKYGGEVKKYRDFVEKAPTYFDPIRKFAATEGPQLAALPIDPVKNDELNQTLREMKDWLTELPQQMDDVIKKDNELDSQKLPDYKGAADTIQSATSNVADNAAATSAFFAKMLTDPKLDPQIKAYMIASVARYDALKKIADAANDDYKKLGELKLDDVRQKLSERDAILVMGPHDMRSLSFDQVWQPDTDRRSYQNQADNTVKPKFAGEQQITSAILSLTTAKKPKVVFLRPGGAPLTTPGFPPFQQGGPLSHIAARLRDYNFDVLEKDMSGQYAMQAQMQGQQVEPEPSDDDIKDAVWIVLSLPSGGQDQQPPPSIAPKVAEHLKAGGSALCLFLPNADNLSGALSEYGIDVRTDLVCVHEAVKTATASGDMIEEAKKNPIIFVLNQFGDSLIAQPLRSLDAAFARLQPVLLTPKPGYTQSTLIPIPTSTPTWGEHNVDAAVSSQDISFNAADGDLPPPLFGGAMSQSSEGGRVVAIGSVDFITDTLLTIPDQEMADRHIRAARFPANAELFCNSVFWLAHMEPLIAISPEAMDVNRIGDMSDAALRFWRVGLLLVGLPLAVVLCGISVYFARRD
jgi:ABC-type uncharacterized transport system